MADLIKIVECPRDAWQGLPALIPAEQKAECLRKLIAAGFTHIDAVSFVSPTAVPQMADSEKVLQLLGPTDGAELIAIVVNELGAERAINAGAVQTLGFPYSISLEFLRRNQNQTQKQALAMLKSVAGKAASAGLNTVAYISMAFGNPYNDPWSIDEVSDACSRLIDLGIREISLADTVGVAAPAQISATFTHVLSATAGAEIGAHLHARSQDAVGKIRAAHQAGCRRFDSAIGGLGGCPFAQDDLVGNIPTEVLVAELTELGAELPTLSPLDDLVRESAEFARNFATQCA
jgi:hydroxymethylglutaryl-CoA lyase